MATLEDLKESAKAIQAEVVDDEFDEDGGIEALQAQDMSEAINLLNKCMHLMAVFADKDLCRSLTKRERDVLSHMSEQVRLFLDDVGQHYDESEDD